MANTAYVGAEPHLVHPIICVVFMQQMRMHVPPHHAVICPIPPSRVPDSHALRRAIRSLGSFTYDDDNETNIKNNVSAFISTYNNMINSSGASDDRTNEKYTEKSEKSDCRI